MNVPARSRRAEISSVADAGWKSSGRSNLTTSSAKAKTPSVRASSRLFEINSLGSAIILAGPPEDQRPVRGADPLNWQHQPWAFNFNVILNREEYRGRRNFGPQWQTHAYQLVRRVARQSSKFNTWMMLSATGPAQSGEIGSTRRRGRTKRCQMVSWPG